MPNAFGIYYTSQICVDCHATCVWHLLHFTEMCGLSCHTRLASIRLHRYVLTVMPHAFDIYYSLQICVDCHATCVWHLLDFTDMSWLSCHMRLTPIALHRYVWTVMPHAFDTYYTSQICVDCHATCVWHLLDFTDMCGLSCHMRLTSITLHRYVWTVMPHAFDIYYTLQICVDCHATCVWHLIHFTDMCGLSCHMRLASNTLYRYVWTVMPHVYKSNTHLLS